MSQALFEINCIRYQMSDKHTDFVRRLLLQINFQTLGVITIEVMAFQSIRGEETSLILPYTNLTITLPLVL